MIRPWHTSLLAAIACTLLSPAALPAQVLARPGWAGSGVSADIWWRHAILYRVNPALFSPATDTSVLHNLAQRLDYIHSLGSDAILLTPIQTDAAHAQTLNPALGTLDDLDDLIRECSRRNMRVLLDLDPAIPAEDLTNIARFWLNRGIAGFHVIGSDDNAHARTATLQKTAASYLGQRILIGDAAPAAPSTPAVTAPTAPAEPTHHTRSRHHAHARSRSSSTASHPTTLDTAAPQLVLDMQPGDPETLSAASIRAAMDSSQAFFRSGRALPLLATDGPGLTRSIVRYGDKQHDIAIAKVMATVLLATKADAMLFNGQELGVDGTEKPLIDFSAPPPAPEKPAATEAAAATAATNNPAMQERDEDSLLNWYRQLSSLHHDNPVIANGINITLAHDEDDALIWIRRPQTASSITPPIIVMCNLSPRPVVLNLKPDIQKLGLKGSFLRTLLRSDGGSGPMHLESMTVEPYTVYIGELRY